MKNANDYQVGGQHYRQTTIQHWDFAAANNLDYFQGQITKYVTRWKSKNGIADLEKARHFLEKYIEIEKIRWNKAPDELPRDRIDKILRPIVATGQENPFGYDPLEECK